MPRPTLASRTALACTGLLIALAGAGCNALEELARDVYENTPKGAPPPPKKDPPPVTDPAKACTGSESCAAGEVCSVELGACDSPPGCGGPETACPAVCYGTCVPKKDPTTDPPPPPPKGEPCGAATCDAGMVCCNSSCGICVPPGGACTKQLCPTPEPPKAECATDADCRTFSNYCEGCACQALSSSEKAPACDGKIVPCFADPCGNQQAVCKAGQCVLTSGAITPTPPPTACEKRTMGGPTSCKPAGTWKQYAHDDCAASGKVLSEITTREACGGDSSVYVDYVCCK
jgi:hypothetical protein